MSENAIFFFSGTGNSFDIAQRLSKKIGETELYNIATLPPKFSISEYKRIGFVFPIYGFTMPNIVRQFLSKMTFKKDTYYFCVATMGAFAMGALYRTAEAISKTGGYLDYATIVYMPENYILFSKVPSDSLINRHLHNSIKRIENIAYDVMSYKRNPAKKTITYGLVQKVSEKESLRWNNTAKSFRISDSCVKCGKCIRLCPVNNISITDNAIYFSDNCECCLLCIHSCPKQSINYGERTIGKKRYINPNVNIEDMKKY